MMRQLTMLAAAFLIGAVMFSSCKKDDVFNVKRNLIDNNWELTTVEADQITQSMFEFMLALVNMKYDFKSDGSYVLTQSVLGFPVKTEGTWSISDDATELTIDDDTSLIIEATDEVLKIGPNDAIMGNVDEDDEIEDDTDYVIVFEAVK